MSWLEIIKGVIWLGVGFLKWYIQKDQTKKLKIKSANKDLVRGIREKDRVVTANASLAIKRMR